MAQPQRVNHSRHCSRIYGSGHQTCSSTTALFRAARILGGEGDEEQRIEPDDVEVEPVLHRQLQEDEERGRQRRQLERRLALGHEGKGERERRQLSQEDDPDRLQRGRPSVL